MGLRKRRINDEKNGLELKLEIEKEKGHDEEIYIYTKQREVKKKKKKKKREIKKSDIEGNQPVSELYFIERYVSRMSISILF